MDLRYRQDGQWRDTPAGIAHYLEHKMFDTQEGSALQELARNGAVENAFTSGAMTAYYFESTEHFYENLRILLRFVSVPWFTEESVAKEQGIIAQEIRMTEDDPDWRVYEGLMTCLYRESPVRVPVAGTVESIRAITPQVLYDCHRAFYVPGNMVLVCVGDVELDQVARLAEEILPAERGEDIPRDYGAGEDDVPRLPGDGALHGGVHAAVSGGYKCRPCAGGEELLNRYTYRRHGLRRPLRGQQPPLRPALQGGGHQRQPRGQL